MLFWLLVALMTGAAMLSVLWPLSWTRTRSTGVGSADLAVYLDQLSEVERDHASGRIPKEEAEAARTEVSRRLLAASNRNPAEPKRGSARDRRRSAALIALIGIPAAALAIYFSIGSPDRVDGSAYARIESPNDRQEIDLLVKQVESHLSSEPNDGRGWELLAPVYLRLGRTGDAVKARENALGLLGSTADREANLGEALVADARGTVIPDARAAFERALLLEKKHIKARFFAGLAAEQNGRKDEAIAIWRGMVAEAPADAPWLPAVRTALARLEGTK